MFKRLLLMIAAVVALSSCATPPVAELEDAKDVVARAYAAGAAQFSPGEYQLASSALQAAELQVNEHDYRKAVRTLELARRYADEALRLTADSKKKLAADRAKAAEKKRQAELKKQQELKRQAELKKQQELKKRRAKEKKKKEVPPIVEKSPVVEVKPVLVDKIEVRSGENLAKIAARKEVYDDPFLWPLIYKANRDQIKDPTEIFSGQTLVVPRDKSRDEADAARREARELNLFDLID
jgi:nucleoid-associated protein YgaU